MCQGRPVGSYTLFILTFPGLHSRNTTLSALIDIYFRPGACIFQSWEAVATVIEVLRLHPSPVVAADEIARWKGVLLGSVGELLQVSYLTLLETGR